MLLILRIKKLFTNLKTHRIKKNMGWCNDVNYKKYNKDGFDILGVSLDRTKEQWERAVEDDNLLWTQVSNLSFWNDPIARRYSIRAIPQSYLIDQSGTVIGKNLRGNDLEERIKFALSLND